jgi:DNA-binding NtrC family response regulator
MDEDKTINVLIVDDEDRFRKTVAASLRKYGFHVKAVGGGWDAVTEVWRDEYDVVVLDIKMPGMDGFKTLREIKRLQPNVQVIMLTGHGSMDSALKSWQDEAFTYLTKPCDVDTLAEMIEYAYAVKTKSTDIEPLAIHASESQSAGVIHRLWPFRKRKRSK